MSSLSLNAEKKLCKHTGRRWPSVSQEERPHQNHLDLELLQNREKINLSSLSYPICDILLWKPEQTNRLHNNLFFFFFFFANFQDPTCVFRVELLDKKLPLKFK